MGSDDLDKESGGCRANSGGEMGERLGSHHCRDLVGSQKWLICSLALPTLPCQGQTMCLMLFSIASNTQHSSPESVLAALI